ncbi:hypothetical protein FC778_05325 [Clostridium botulinum]|nr:hypothetical protein [Clostridium botulinum]
MDIEKLRKEMTREEFLNDINLTNTEGCPNEYKLKEYESCKCKDITCKECWRNAVKDIKFKDDIEVKKLSKELNILQTIEMPVGTEFEVILDGEKYNMNAKITKAKVVGKKQLVWDNRAYIEVVINDSILNAKFIPIQQPVSFMEATEKGNKIKVQHELLESCEMYTHYFYLRDLMYNLSNDFDNNDLKKIFKEGKWYIEESVNND